MTALCNLMRIFQCFCRIWKKTFHLFRRFYIILTALITHTILICQFLTSLQAEQDIMWLGILCQGIMYVICCDQINSGLTVHLKKLLVYILLFRNTMIL